MSKATENVSPKYFKTMTKDRKEQTTPAPPPPPPPPPACPPPSAPAVIPLIHYSNTVRLARQQRRGMNSGAGPSINNLVTQTILFQSPRPSALSVKSKPLRNSIGYAEGQ
ncbi:hypothetical protein E2C01_032817 [Portunus trituberculatus]|uniref:Uncharacterized protein n=1 Tax=Portunus trituberculatus TaxID=210409 RepID=A0A5B7F1R5_PORTR|nr:hypothetical protein [Portunus trituberculatus]